MHTDAAAAEYWPLAHGMQSQAPAEAAMLPPGQSMQAEAPAKG